jgi:hypothetical protein
MMLQLTRTPTASTWRGGFNFYYEQFAVAEF